jgi:hypothetical protein
MIRIAQGMATNVSVVVTALAAFCLQGAERTTMLPQTKVQGQKNDQDILPPPMISGDGQLVAGFYKIVQFGPKRVGFAVVDAADQVHHESLQSVPMNDKVGIARLKAAAEAYLSKGEWRAMATPDLAGFDSGLDSLHWKNLNLSVTVSGEGSLWFSQTDKGTVLGATPLASRLIEKRGCEVNMLYHKLVFNDIAGFDPKTRLAFIAFDVVEGHTDSAEFRPFRCDPSALMHVIQVDPPKR